jgi:hypothetical protein
MRIVKIKFDDDKIPAWMYENKEPSIYTFAETIALAGLEDKFIRLSASLQRRLLGFPVFGKQEFTLKGDGTFSTYCKVCFGTDYETTSGPQAYIGVAARNQLKISPRFFGKGYFSVYAYEHDQVYSERMGGFISAK